MKPVKRQSNRRKRPDDMPRRALSGYNIFFRDERGKIMEQQKREGVSGSSTFGALGRTVAERWKQLKPEEYERYSRLAAEDKIRYKQEMDQYKANTLAVRKLEPAESRNARELPMVYGVAKDFHLPYGTTDLAANPHPTFSELRLQQQDGSVFAPGYPTPFAGSSTSDFCSLPSRPLAGFQSPPDLSATLLAQYPTLYSQLLVPLPNCRPHFSLADVPLNSRITHVSLLDEQVALLEAERGRQLEQQASQQLLQNAVAYQQFQLAMAQQSSLASAGASQQPSYLSNVLRRGHMSHLDDAAGHDPLLGNLRIPLESARSLESSGSMSLTPQLRHYLQQEHQIRGPCYPGPSGQGMQRF
jgi:hypothetical protein